MALCRTDQHDPALTTEGWEEIIRALTPEGWEEIIRALTPDYYQDNEPWQLVVDDIRKPAFMQPPASSVDKLKDYDKFVSTPDELDIIGTSKNHDLKSTVGDRAAIDDWIFSLVALQTNSAQDGVGNYSVSRTRSAYSSRAVLSIAPAEMSNIKTF